MERRLALELGQDEVDKRTRDLGTRVSQSYLSQIERGARSLEDMGAARMEALRRVYKLTPEEWAIHTGLSIVTPSDAALNEDGSATKNKVFDGTERRKGGMISGDISHLFIEIPVYGSVSAGSPGNLASEANVIAHEIIPRSEYRNGNTLALYVTGNSMSPTIEDGELVVADKSLTDLEEDFMYLIQIDGEGPCVKRAMLLGDIWLLASDNRAYKPFQAEDAVILGQVYYGQPRGKRYGSRNRPS